MVVVIHYSDPKGFFEAIRYGDVVFPMTCRVEWGISDLWEVVLQAVVRRYGVTAIVQTRIHGVIEGKRLSYPHLDIEFEDVEKPGSLEMRKRLLEKVEELGYIRGEIWSGELADVYVCHE